MIVVVGSKNKTKIRPVKKIFSKYFKDVKVIGVDVTSGVSEQPLSEEETYKGALNRAKGALEINPNADFGVGIEGGIMSHVAGLHEKTIIVIINRKGEMGVGISPALFLPNKITTHINNGKNLSEAIEEVFGISDIGNGIGAYGVFTKGVVTRSSGMEDSIAFALSRFLHDNIF